MKKAVIILISIVLILGCAGTSETAKSSEPSGGCAAPSKTYGNADVDNFLQTSYTICTELQEAKELLSEANAFVADPAAYAAEKGVEAKAKLMSQVNAMINSIPERILKKAGITLKGSGDVTSAAKNLAGMDKMKAIKDVNAAISNLKNASETAPKIVEEFNALLAKF